ncbi:MAG: DNA polymerase III subunit delta [Lachnospiraceae bacterium]|nr:DNA polymerase III subunit delta [Lachnospiraceae bacterium]
MADVSTDIKSGQYKSVYLIHGDERYLRENYSKKLLKALVAPGDNLNFASFEGDGTDINEVISLAQTLPFMAEKRVVFVKDSGFFHKSCEELDAYLSAPSEDTVLIFDEEKVDKRSRNYKAVTKLKGDVNAVPLKDKDLKQWVAALFLRKYEKKVRESTIELLISRVGTDMSVLSSEIGKIAGYSGDREVITDEDVTTMTKRNPSGSVFEMIEAMTLKKQSSAVSVYYEMLEAKENPYGILSLIERQFRIIYIVKEMTEKKASREETAMAAGIRDFLVQKYQKQAAKYSKTKIRQIINECVAADADSKSGKISDTLAVELLIIKFSS